MEEKERDTGKSHWAFSVRRIHRNAEPPRALPPLSFTTKIADVATHIFYGRDERRETYAIVYIYTYKQTVILPFHRGDYTCVCALNFFFDTEEWLSVNKRFFSLSCVYYDRV